MKKIVLTFGVLSGLFAALMFVVSTVVMKNSSSDVLNNDWMAVFGWTTILISMSFIFFGVRSFRDTYQNGVITFGKAFTVGILIALLSAVIYVIAWEIVYYTYMPDFYARYGEHMMEKLKTSGASAEKIEQTAKQMDMYKNMGPLMVAAFTFLEPFPIGLLVSLITALVLKRKEKKALQV
jgi:hypothetical protein